MRLWDDKRVPAKVMDIIGLDILIKKDNKANHTFSAILIW